MSGKIKYTEEEREIAEIILRIGRPQPIIIKKNEYFNVNKIIRKRKVYNKIKYLVSWEGYEDRYNCWVDEKILQEDVPELLEEYKKNTK